MQVVARRLFGQHDYVRQQQGGKPLDQAGISWAHITRQLPDHANAVGASGILARTQKVRVCMASARVYSARSGKKEGKNHRRVAIARIQGF